MGYAVRNDGLGWRAVNSADDRGVDEIYSETQPALVKSIEMLKQDKRQQVSDRCEAEIAAISAGYPAGEVLSWSKQESEARGYKADSSVATTLLDALAAARGVTKADLASRVIVKADMFAQISGAIIGKRQALEDQINALPADATAADLDAIQW